MYKVNPDGQETALHTFPGGPNGWRPNGVIRDSEGHLYGTTTYGGSAELGLIFELSTAGQYQVLYAFTGGADGAVPAVGLVRDSAGNLYGVTNQGGNPACNSGIGCGAVFQLNPSGQLTVLHSFTGRADGSGRGALTLGSDGVLYGPAAGGTFQGGLIYRLTPN